MKFADSSHRVVVRQLPGGGCESFLATTLSEEDLAEVQPADAPSFAASIAAAVRQIDADTDAIYGACIGNRATEYKLAEEQAQAFKDAGYMGTAPASVASWAAAKGWMDAQAAIDILDTASQWLDAQAAIRATRLACKEQARAAQDHAGVEAALAAWAGFVAAMRAALGL
jgi:hypothetical protein